MKLFTIICFPSPFSAGFCQLSYPIELIAIILTTYAVITLLQNGSVRCAAGIFLLAVYLMLGVGFYYAPAVGH